MEVIAFILLLAAFGAVPLSVRTQIKVRPLRAMAFRSALSVDADPWRTWLAQMDVAERADGQPLRRVFNDDSSPTTSS